VILEFFFISKVNKKLRLSKIKFLHILLFPKFTNLNSICLFGQSSFALFFSPEKLFYASAPYNYVLNDSSTKVNPSLYLLKLTTKKVIYFTFGISTSQLLRYIGPSSTNHAAPTTTGILPNSQFVIFFRL